LFTHLRLVFLVVSFLHIHLCFFPPMSFTAFTSPWPLLHFRNHFFTQTVGLFGRVISPSQGRYLYTGQHKHRINA
jgi:hypothetical protein